LSRRPFRPPLGWWWALLLGVAAEGASALTITDLSAGASVETMLQALLGDSVTQVSNVRFQGAAQAGGGV